MMGDGKTAYDHATDGANNEIAGCSVSFLFLPLSVSKSGSADSVRFRSLLSSGLGFGFGFRQANYRKTEVASKARLTYIKGEFLELKLHYKCSFLSSLPPLLCTSCSVQPPC
jgi:hypothetical protein